MGSRESHSPQARGDVNVPSCSSIRGPADAPPGTRRSWQPLPSPPQDSCCLGSTGSGKQSPGQVQFSSWFSSGFRGTHQSCNAMGWEARARTARCPLTISPCRPSMQRRRRRREVGIPPPPCRASRSKASARGARSLVSSLGRRQERPGRRWCHDPQACGKVVATAACLGTTYRRSCLQVRRQKYHRSRRRGRARRMAPLTRRRTRGRAVLPFVPSTRTRRFRGLGGSQTLRCSGARFRDAIDSSRWSTGGTTVASAAAWCAPTAASVASAASASVLSVVNSVQSQRRRLKHTHRPPLSLPPTLRVLRLCTGPGCSTVDRPVSPPPLHRSQGHPLNRQPCTE